MYKRYKTDRPNQVHQLLVSVSKHYFIGAKNQIRHQSKMMDISLKHIEKAKKVNVVYYILRDHFSGFYYVEITSTDKLIPLQDFLLRGFLRKPDIPFCGIPQNLMIPKHVEEFFPPIEQICENLGIKSMYPPSGFASGINAVSHWEKIMKIPLIPDQGPCEISSWNPRVSAYYCKTYNSDSLSLWKNNISNVLVPEDEYAKKIGSTTFHFANEYPLFKPLWN